MLGGLIRVSAGFTIGLAMPLTLDDLLFAAKALAAEAADGFVTATVGEIDTEAKRFTARFDDDDSEIDLQSGREIVVSFSDLPKLTGMNAEDVLARLRRGQTLAVELEPQPGDAVKVVRIRFLDDELPDPGPSADR